MDNDFLQAQMNIVNAVGTMVDEYLALTRRLLPILEKGMTEMMAAWQNKVAPAVEEVWFDMYQKAGMPHGRSKFGLRRWIKRGGLQRYLEKAARSVEGMSE